jgi:centrosomal protein CEP19
MDSKFLANRLKPGDPGYVYDKAVDFGGPTEAADWDEEDSSGGSGGSDADR